jgi:Serine protease inhibitor
MKKLLSIGLILFLMNSLVGSTEQDFVDANNELAFKVSRQLDSEKNYVFSPYAIYSFLGILQLGSDSEQLSNELAVIFDFPENKEVLARTFGSINRKITKDSVVSFPISLWLDRSKSIKPSLRSILTENFNFQYELVDVTKLQEVAGAMNRWLQKSSGGRLANSIVADELSSINNLTSSILNVALFDETWAEEFDADRNSFAPFKLADETNINACFMNRESEEYVYHRTNEYEACTAFYVNRKYSLVLIKAIKPKSLNKFSLTDLKGIIANTKKGRESYSLVRVNLFLPKFDFDFNLRIESVLAHVGINSIFENYVKCLVEEVSVRIEIMRMYAGIKVHEKGSQVVSNMITHFASYGTGSYVTPVRITFRLDEEFLFYIINEETGLILFAGKVVDPSN